MTTTIDPTIPQFSTQLWSECVGIAMVGEDMDAPTIQYEFSNGRKFTQRYPYGVAPDAPPPEPTP